TSRRVRRAAMLLPIAQGRDGQVERLGEFRLRHPETLPEHLDARYPAHPSQLFRSERLGIRIRQRGGHDLLIGHGIKSLPIGVAPWQGVTRFHVYPRSTGLAHVAWPSGPI